MTELKAPIAVQTAFADYELTSILGEGGAGRVYGGQDDVGNPIALKLLTNVNTDKRKRFKNETGFLTRNTHPNIVTVIDSGIGIDAKLKGPFYIMKRYSGSLREQMASHLAPAKVIGMFSQMLDGVEAAHMLGATHRDLKPENFLFDAANNRLAVADFGVASFTAQDLLTLVETLPQQRLANFYYAAPEQKTRGTAVDGRADIYALGLMLNELFTGQIPHGTNPTTIASVDPEFAFLDEIVATMLRQQPAERPSSIAELKQKIELQKELQLTRQRLDTIAHIVVREGDVTDPLAFDPPVLVGANWSDDVLTLTLDRGVNNNWTRAFYNMGNYSSVMGRGPETFQFHHDNNRLVSAAAAGHEVQRMVNNFKRWLIQTTQVLHQTLKSEAERSAHQERQRLEQARQREEAKMKVNSSIRI
jgi:serine/threonine protein kinase